MEWSDAGLEGAYRFLKRVWVLAFQTADTFIKQGLLFCKGQSLSPVEWALAESAVRHYRREIYETLQQARFDYERLQFNTVVSGSMKLLNLLYKVSEMPVTESNAEFLSILMAEGMSILLRILSPIAPHITHYLWKQLGYEGLIVNAKWPKINNDALKVNASLFIL